MPDDIKNKVPCDNPCDLVREQAEEIENIVSDYEEACIIRDGYRRQCKEQREQIATLKEARRIVLLRYTRYLRDYMRESGNNIGLDDREDSEFVDTFLLPPEPEQPIN